MDFANSAADGIEQELAWQVPLYEQLHRNPELGLAEHQTSAAVTAKLAAWGFVVRHFGGTGVVGVLANGPGPGVLARADMDALPVTEATGARYASAVPGVMHACAHDMHVVALLGAAKYLADHRDAWRGTYTALFQPAEETAAGSQAMLDDGLAAGIPQPDVALAQHVMPTEEGTIGTTPGPVLSAGDSVRITVHGRGAHGSMPHKSVDPVVLAASIVLRLQTVVSRETIPGEFAVLTVGSVSAGATANIIPDRAELLLNLRTYDLAVRAAMVAAIERIVRGECAAAGSPQEPEFEYYDQYPLTSNDAEANARVTAAFTRTFGADAVYRTAPQTASEDFSRIPDAFGIPYVYWIVGSVPPETYRRAVANGTVDADIPANHSPSFLPAVDPTVRVATRAQAAAALAYLGADEA
ncbi:hippurate hydrolase [Pseudarthrobacter defluvii]|uniref:Hippurate hydrolase n=1 Tax=Pseudarthrobacter defluvii TaxID=410837 RepID=A0ABT9UJI6_9MICC|nr:amidohydrolase [Pseudarthrobacter defluvii]MDQ0119791.1 hippurate hydrolase [Pseudarthrobacter defluvii]